MEHNDDIDTLKLQVKHHEAALREQRDYIRKLEKILEAGSKSAYGIRSADDIAFLMDSMAHNGVFYFGVEDLVIKRQPQPQPEPQTVTYTSGVVYTDEKGVPLSEEEQQAIRDQLAVEQDKLLKRTQVTDEDILMNPMAGLENLGEDNG